MDLYGITDKITSDYEAKVENQAGLIAANVMEGYMANGQRYIHVCKDCLYESAQKAAHALNNAGFAVEYGMATVPVDDNESDETHLCPAIAISTREHYADARAAEFGQFRLGLTIMGAITALAALGTRIATGNNWFWCAFAVGVVTFIAAGLWLIDRGADREKFRTNLTQQNWEAMKAETIEID